MSLFSNLSAFEQSRSRERVQGRSMSSGSGMNYSAESERGIGAIPVIPNDSAPLQNLDGSFAFALDPLGTGARIPGRYWIDTFGKFRPY